MYSAYDYSEVISCTWLSFSLPGLIRVASSSCIGVTTISSSSIQPVEIFHCHIEPSINPMHTVNLIPSGSHTADWVTGPLSNLDDVMCFIFDSLRSVFAFNICICWIINPVLPLKMKTSPSAINVSGGKWLLYIRRKYLRWNWVCTYLLGYQIYHSQKSLNRN